MAETQKCEHRRTKLIAEDEHEKYVECLDCGAILEAEELSMTEKPAAVSNKETLGDA
jgi:hypothetical protein